MTAVRPIDCNAFLGNWAFRRLRRNDAQELLAMMDHFGITQACVASADAILYRDCHAGNEEIFEETRKHADRFWLYATLNPAYAGWERDLASCAERGFKAVRLYPYYHEYALDGADASRIIDAATEAGLPVSIPGRVVDVRQRHWMDTKKNLDVDQLIRVAGDHPNATFLLTEGLLNAPPGDDFWSKVRGVNVYVEMSRMTSVLANSIGTTIDELGADRMLFGTGFPFKTPSPAFLKIQILEADAAVKQQILSENAKRLFGA